MTRKPVRRKRRAATPGGAAVRDPVVEFLCLRYSDADAVEIAARLRQTTPDQIAPLFLTTDEIATLRRLPPEEIAALRQRMKNHSKAVLDLDTELAELERAWEESGHRDYQPILAALYFCRTFRRPLPYWLFKEVERLILAQLPQKMPLDYKRWELVRQLLHDGEKPRSTVLDRAAAIETKVTGKPVKASTVHQSYKKIERTMSPEDRWKNREGHHRSPRKKKPRV